MWRAALRGLAMTLGISLVVALVVIPCAWAADDTRARDAKSRDLVFLGDPSCRGDAVLCARQVHFNGDWRQVQLCRRGRCVRYEDVFPFERIVGPEEQR